VREAVILQGFEEARHAEFLRRMIRSYGIAAEEGEVAPLGRDLHRAFADFGYGECLDSFLGFGVFDIARRSGFLPEPLFALFDTLLDEETRHIVFFINWMAWQQAESGHPAPWRAAVAAFYYGRAIGRLLGTIRRGRAADDGREFSATEIGLFLDDFTLRGLVDACCAEHTRRMRDFDPELLQPRLLPRLGGIAIAALQLGFPARAARSGRA
jgi:hypothetical protein